MRGDRPDSRPPYKIKRPATPHARGSTPFWRSAFSSSIGYPACAGIDRNIALNIFVLMRLPRMRGDRPLDLKRTGSRQEATPHARGSTFTVTEKIVKINGYPACAGIDPLNEEGKIAYRWLPRMRGDRPLFLLVQFLLELATPHARGSTRSAVRFD